MSVKNVVKALPITSFDSADILITYQPININGFGEAPFLVRINNDSNQDVAISFDGTTDNEYVVMNSDITFNFLSGMQPNAQVPCFPKGTVVYVRGLSAGTGRIYLSAYYMPTT